MSDRAKELADELREDGVFVDAADELDRLRAELDLATEDRDALQAEVKRLTAAVMAFTVMAVACVAVLLIAYLIWGGA
jgi:hypothetical protein